jgi:hypothetical protein
MSRICKCKFTQDGTAVEYPEVPGWNFGRTLGYTD